MSVRLFVGNLPYDTTEAELRDHLSSAGQLSSVYFPMNRDTGKPRGFAFVEFDEGEQAQEAIRRFNNLPFKGRNLSISEARAKESRPDDEGRSRPPRAPRDFRAPVVAPPVARPLRTERPAASNDTDQQQRRRRSGRKASDFSSRSERGPKRPIREKPGGRIYEDFEDDYLGEEEDSLEDDFSRREDYPEDEV